MANPAPKKIAVACQGGGTHAAFTVGVLTAILNLNSAVGWWRRGSVGGFCNLR
jgi:predicted acylesterase/phospholipase RssA